MSETAQFLESIFGSDLIGDGWLNLCHEQNGSGFHTDSWWTAHQLPDMAKQGLSLQGDVWFSAAPRRARLNSGRGTSDDIDIITALWLDVDYGKPGAPPTRADAEELFDRFEYRPSTVVHSGHGLQPWWWLVEPVELSEHPDLLDRWQATWSRIAAESGYRLDNVSDAARVMRLPGTINHKFEPVPVEIVWARDDAAAYHVGDIAELLDDVGKLPTSKPADHEPAAPQQAPRQQWHKAVAKAFEAACGPMGKGSCYEVVRDRVLELCRYEQAGLTGATSAIDEIGERWLQPETLAARSSGDTYTTAGGKWRDIVEGGREKVRTTASTHIPDAKIFGTGTDKTTTTVVPEVEDFWTRDELRHIRSYARAQMAAPWSVLAGVLARIVCQVPATVVLPDIIYDHASLNMAFALVSPSGGGKGGSTLVARRAVDIGADNYDVHTLGSGQGMAHGYGHYERGKNGEPGKIERHADSVLFIVEEIDQLAAHHSQNASTTLAELRRFLMGEKLGHLYVDVHKRVQIAAHSYRGALLAGVQPARAGVILNDVDAGTPQRFLWLPTIDHNPPEELPDRPAPLQWRLPPSTALPKPEPWSGLRPIPVCRAVIDAVRQAQRERVAGEGDPLDGHALLTRERVAAALGLLSGRYGIDDEDWQLAGKVMAVSNATRAGVVDRLEARERAANEARAHSEADREEIKEHRQDQRVARHVLRVLRKQSDWMARSELRRSLNSRDRVALESGVDNLIAAGQIEAEETAHGARYRVVEQ